MPAPYLQLLKMPENAKLRETGGRKASDPDVGWLSCLDVEMNSKPGSLAAFRFFYIRNPRSYNRALTESVAWIGRSRKKTTTC